MAAMSRADRATVVQTAKTLRTRGQREGWPVERIAAVIRGETEVSLLEAWRLAYGWTRPQALDGLAELYRQDGLRPPPVTAAMLCRWEHHERQASPEYAGMLCRLYRAQPAQLGLPTHPTMTTVITELDWYGPHQGQPHQGHQFTYQGVGRSMAGHGYQTLTAVRESIQLALDVEGPAGGPTAHDQLDAAVQHYALNYSAYPPGVLFAEVQLCRSLVAGMLPHQAEQPRKHLRQVAGWLSALLGNLAFHLADHTGATTHFAAAVQLGRDTADDRLVAWSRGAQAMLARQQQRFTDALDMARDGLRFTHAPIQRAQLLAWAELPALAGLGRRTDAETTLAAAERELDADPTGDTPGRFGFDRAEFTLHAAESYILLNLPEQAARYATTSIDRARPGSPGWAAATLTLAQAEFPIRPDQTADLAIAVIDAIPATQLRDTSRRRLATADTLLSSIDHPRADALHERIRGLPSASSADQDRPPAL